MRFILMSAGTAMKTLGLYDELEIVAVNQDSKATCRMAQYIMRAVAVLFVLEFKSNNGTLIQDGE